MELEEEKQDGISPLEQLENDLIDLQDDLTLCDDAQQGKVTKGLIANLQLQIKTLRNQELKKQQAERLEYNDVSSQILNFKGINTAQQKEAAQDSQLVQQSIDEQKAFQKINRNYEEVPPKTSKNFLIYSEDVYGNAEQQQLLEEINKAQKQKQWPRQNRFQCDGNNQGKQ